MDVQGEVCFCGVLGPGGSTADTAVAAIEVHGQFAPRNAAVGYAGMADIVSRSVHDDVRTVCHFPYNINNLPGIVAARALGDGDGDMTDLSVIRRHKGLDVETAKS